MFRWILISVALAAGGVLIFFSAISLALDLTSHSHSWSDYFRFMMQAYTYLLLIVALIIFLVGRKSMGQRFKKHSS